MLTLPPTVLQILRDEFQNVDHVQALHILPPGRADLGPRLVVQTSQAPTERTRRNAFGAFQRAADRLALEVEDAPALVFDNVTAMALLSNATITL